MGEVVGRFVLLEGQLQLAHCVLYLQLEDHVLGLLLRESVVHLDYSIALHVAQLVDCTNGHFEVIDGLEHDLGPQQVADFAPRLDLIGFPFFDHFSNFLRPGAHDSVDDVPNADVLRRLLLCCLLQGLIDLADNELHLLGR